MPSVSSAAPVVVEVLAAILLLSAFASIRVLLRGCAVLRRWRRESARPYRDVLLKSPLVPGVSVVAVVTHGDPDYVPFVRRQLNLEFGEREVVVVLNGASPRAVETWSEDFHLFQSYRPCGAPLATGPVRAVYESKDPIQLVVVDKEAGSTADAYNAGLNASSTPYLAVIDSEADFEQDTLLRLIVPILEDPERTLAVCAGVPDASEGSLVGRFAEIESLRSWLGRSLAFAGWNALLPTPGQAAIIQRQVIVRAGGWLAGLPEMFLQLHGYARKANHAHRIAFLPDPICRPRTVRGFDDLRRHVAREQQWVGGAIRRLGSIHKGWGALGSWGVLALVWDRFLRPLLETLAYAATVVALAMGWIGRPLAVLMLLATVVSGILVSMSAVVMRELAEYRASDPAVLTGLFFAAIPENLGYRQLRNLWLIAGFFRNPE